MDEVNQAQRAYNAWKVLARCAQEKTSITYGELANQLGIHHRPIRFVLSLIQDYCLDEKLPPLTILVVSKGGVPGAGFIAWDVSNLEDGYNKVYAYPWNRMENPFQFAAGGDTYEALAEGLVHDPNRSGEVYAQVKVRGIAQTVFRETIRKVYQGACAFSGISIPEVLEAVHIVPWSKCDHNERLDPRNGLLLTSFHHKLFDAQKITLQEDYRIFVSQELRNRSSRTDAEKAFLDNLHGTEARLPASRDLWPSRELIRRHNDDLGIFT